MAPLAAVLRRGRQPVAGSRPGTHVDFAGFRGNVGLFAVSLAYGLFVSAVGGGIGAWLARRRTGAAAAGGDAASRRRIAALPPHLPSHLAAALNPVRAGRRVHLSKGLMPSGGHHEGAHGEKTPPGRIRSNGLRRGDARGVAAGAGTQLRLRAGASIRSRPKASSSMNRGRPERLHRRCIRDVRVPADRRFRHAAARCSDRCRERSGADDHAAARHVMIGQGEGDRRQRRGRCPPSSACDRTRAIR